MDAVLVDTNVVSFSLKGDTRWPLYAPHLSGRRGCVAFVTVAELYRWAVVRKWGPRRIGILKDELSKCVVLPFVD